MTKPSNANINAVADLKPGYTLGAADVALLQEMARRLLAVEGQEPVGVVRAVNTLSGMTGLHVSLFEKLPVGTEVYAAPHPVPVAQPVQVPDDYFASLVAAARARADKAMRKFPQPNYVLNKVAEENGEVIKAVIHYTEGREEWSNVEGEIIDNLAMLIRLVQEGDQVIGFTPPDACRVAMLKAEPVSQPYKLPDGYVLVPVEPTAGMREAYHQAQAEYEDEDGLWSPDHQWQAMLAAAPQEPTK